MTAMVAGAAWAVLVLLAAHRHRPPPARALALIGRAAAPRPVGAVRADPLAVLGVVVLRCLPPGARARADRLTPLAHAPAPAGALPTASDDSRPGPYRGTAARAVGALSIAAVVALVVAPPVAPLVVVAGVVVPRSRARAAQRRRLRRLEAALPDTVDLLVLAVGAGCNVPLALAAAGRRGTGELAAELKRVSADVGRGRRLADALDDLPARAGEPTRALAGVLAGCERYGTPVLPALNRLADEVRLQRQRRAEAAARRVPVTLLFPLVLCILPAFALLTVAPLVAGALRELRL